MKINWLIDTDKDCMVFNITIFFVLFGAVALKYFSNIEPMKMVLCVLVACIIINGIVLKFISECDKIIGEQIDFIVQHRINEFNRIKEENLSFIMAQKLIGEYGYVKLCNVSTKDTKIKLFKFFDYCICSGTIIDQLIWAGNDEGYLVHITNDNCKNNVVRARVELCL